LWYLKIYENTLKDQTHLFSVLLHEISHALGISHLNNQDSIMYTFNINNKIDLDQYDILAKQSLYDLPSQ
jgi:predicted Zn-dependent protease